MYHINHCLDKLYVHEYYANYNNNNQTNKHEHT